MSADHPALADLDSIAWNELSHAYGPAGDTPELLRLLTSGVDEQARDAEQELWSSICHQGSVYPATVAAVPFLARLAAAGVGTTGLLGLLGVIAESLDERGINEPGSAQRAVAGQYDLIAPLAQDSPDDEVRATALFVLAHAGPADRVISVLEQRWSAESIPELRAGVLHAAMVQNPSRAGAMAVMALDDTQTPLVRLTAVLACVRAGVTWSERHLAAGTAWTRDDLPPVHWCWGQDLFSTLVRVVAEHVGPPTAVDLVIRALGGDGPVPASVRTQGLYAAGHLVRTYRSAVPLLAGPIAALAVDEHNAMSALALLRCIGTPPGTGYVDEVAARAANHGPDEIADQALACLVEWGDARAAPLLATDLTSRPRALGAAIGFPTGNPRTTLPFDLMLLDAICIRLRELTSAHFAQKRSDLIERTSQHNEPIHLAGILRTWGPDAAPAVPELAGLVPHQPLAAARALAAINQASDVCRIALQEAAYTGQTPSRLAAARTLRDLTGQTQPLLDAVMFGLGLSRHDLSAAADMAAVLQQHSTLLVPLLLQALEREPAPSRTKPDLEARVQVAAALWQHTGDSETVLPILSEALSWASRDFGQWTAVACADAAAWLGTHARDLIPVLDSMLEDPVTCPAAAHALLCIDLDQATAGEARNLLADKLITAVAHGSALRAQRRALDVLADLAATGLPSTAFDHLRQLADQDRRIVHSGIETNFIQDDEALREAILALLHDVEPQRPAAVENGS